MRPRSRCPPGLHDCRAGNHHTATDRPRKLRSRAMSTDKANLTSTAGMHAITSETCTHPTAEAVTATLPTTADISGSRSPENRRECCSRFPPLVFLRSGCVCVGVALPLLASFTRRHLRTPTRHQQCSATACLSLLPHTPQDRRPPCRPAGLCWVRSAAHAWTGWCRESALGMRHTSTPLH